MRKLPTILNILRIKIYILLCLTGIINTAFVCRATDTDSSARAIDLNETHANLSSWVSQINTYPANSLTTENENNSGSLKTLRLPGGGCSHVINYTLAGPSPCYGDSVQFSSTNTTPTVSWLWDFGDGDTSILQDPLHVFPQTGSYTVSLTTIDTGSCTATSSLVININDTFYVDAGNDTIVCNSNAQLNATLGQSGNYSYQWSPSIGLSHTSSASTFATNVWDQTYTVTLTDVNTGCTTSDSLTVSTVEVADDTIIICSDSVQLEMPPGGTSYYWGINGDTTMATWVSQIGSYTGLASYPTCGAIVHRYHVVSCFNNCSHIINYSSGGASCYGDSIQFSPTSVTPTVSWSWDFGDGDTSILEDPLHVFPQAGTYNVSLTTIDSNQCISTSVLPVHVYDTFYVDAGPDITSCQSSAQLSAIPGQPGHYTFNWSPPTGLSNPNGQYTSASNIYDQTYTISITDTMTGCTAIDSLVVSSVQTANYQLQLCSDSILLEMPAGATSYAWAGNSQTTQAIWVSQIGTYHGIYQHPTCGTVGHHFYVNPCLSACSHLISYNNASTNTCNGDSIQFTSSSTTQTTSWLWDFGDGSTSSLANPSHVYSADSNYTITLITTDTANCADTTTTTAIFFGPIDPNITANTTVGCQECVVLSSSVNQGHFTWLDGSGNLVGTSPTLNDICHAQNDTFILNVTHNNCSLSDTISVSAYNSVIDTFSLCYGDVTLDFGPGADHYYWQTFTDQNGNPTSLSDTTQTIIATQAGTYFGHADFPGCGSLTSQFVVDTCPSACYNNINYSYISSFDCGDSINLNGIANTPVVSWNWDFGDGTTSDQQNTANFFSAGTYNVSLTTIDTSGCSYTSYRTLTLANGFSVTAIATPNPGCQQCVTLSANFNSPIPPYHYQWADAHGNALAPVNTTPADICHAHNDTIVLTAIDEKGCINSDGILVNSYNPVVDTFIICAPETTILDFGPGADHYYWQTFTDVHGNLTNLTDTTQTIAVSQPGVYLGYADFPGCGSLTSQFTVREMCPDSVWPGDANSDGIANNLDLLSIGIGYGASGPVRPNASIAWVGQAAFEWIDTLASGVNYKHIDCEGDGDIDLNDTLPILLNYNLVHNKTPEATIGDGPLLYMVPSLDTAGVSTLVNVSIRLGTNIKPATDVYGLAFTLHFDPALVDTNSISMSYANSWMGNQNQSMAGIRYLSASNGWIDAAVTRINHANASGFGQVATLSFITIDNLSGKVNDLSEILDLIFSDIVLIDTEENILSLSSENSSVVITEKGIGIKEIDLDNDISLFPNPATDILYIRSENDISDIKIYDAYGRLLMFETASNKQYEMDISRLAAGIYHVEIWQNADVVKKQLTVIDK